MAWIWLGLLACNALTVREVTTGASEAYPGLRSIFQPIPPGAAMQRTISVVEGLDGWGPCERTRPYELVCTVEPVLGGTDTVTIDVAPHGPRVTRVRLTARHEGALGDLGGGAQRIRAFQEAFLAEPAHPDASAPGQD
ncbi:MAG: hypothetical protein H6739_40300 [Alphaproteobacteria bacterium]|nr:hypothetical protein [Alphaproteobacteria bacterium]